MLKSLVFLMALLAASQGWAASYDEDDHGAFYKKPDGFREVIGLVTAGKFDAALPRLLRLEEKAPRDADIKNLLGFTHRKLGNLGASGAFYRAALEIEPEHRKALEYQGELFLMQGDLAAARHNLAKLKALCWISCAEHDLLKKAIEAHQSR